MWWIVGLCLVGVLSPALAQDSAGDNEPMEVENARRASDQAIVRFNTDIADFPSWDLFKAVVLAQVTPGMLGTCYTYEGGRVRVTTEPLPKSAKASTWQKTAGKGWQQTYPDRTFIEYRYNEKAGVLLWVEGVNPRFFFAYTRKMCELPLGVLRP